jgi:HK97 family phage prohead protease
MMEKETRTINFELRAKPESRTIEGYAAIFDTETDLGWFKETLSRSAFDGADMTDVVALFNHDPNFPLARTTSGTLQLQVDERGLKYSFEAPDTTYGEDLLKMIKRGDISQSSFAFTIKNETWDERSGDKPKRRIDAVDALYDVSPVTYPAYKETSVTARMRQNIENPTPQGVADKDYPQLIADILNLKK